MKCQFRWLLASVGPVLAGGCQFWNSASPGLEADPFKIGTGEPVVTPINDNRFWNGEPMDMRNKR